MKTRAFQRLRRPLRTEPKQARPAEMKAVAVLKGDDLAQAAGGRKVNEYEGQHR